jgi:hypothetical protein
MYGQEGKEVREDEVGPEVPHVVVPAVVAIIVGRRGLILGDVLSVYGLEDGGGEEEEDGKELDGELEEGEELGWGFVRT